jgi:hypothetical protein
MHASHVARYAPYVTHWRSLPQHASHVARYAPYVTHWRSLPQLRCVYTTTETHAPYVSYRSDGGGTNTLCHVEHALSHHQVPPLTSICVRVRVCQLTSSTGRTVPHSPPAVSLGRTRPSRWSWCLLARHGCRPHSQTISCGRSSPTTSCGRSSPTSSSALIFSRTTMAAPPSEVDDATICLGTASSAQGGVVCQNRAAPRAPVKLMSNIAETARQNHTVHKPPPCQNQACPQGPILYIPHEIVRKNAKNFAPAAGLFLDVTSSSALQTPARVVYRSTLHP